MKRSLLPTWARRAMAFAAVAIGAAMQGLFAHADGHRFVNFESPQVHPLDLSPNGNLLAACNTANGTVDVFSVATGAPAFQFSVPVGVDPASARFRTDTELWVCNWISDSVSIVDIAQQSVVRTLLTRDEPADVVFTSNGKAFVACSQPDTVLVYDTGILDAAPAAMKLKGKFPRALAVSEDGARVHVAIFQSGNKSTLLAEDFHLKELVPVLPDRVVSRPDGPHGGQNPPFNGNGQFVPPLAPGLPPPPPVDLIVKQDAAGLWRDDTGADWTKFVSGEESHASGRVPGWHLPDYDLASIDANTLDVSYVSGLMNICMAIAVRPGSGEVAVVGTDAINEVRFEPNVGGRTVKVEMALAGGTAPPRIVDLNADHVDYGALRIAEELRGRSVGDPRAVAWNDDGTEAWVAGMGSNTLLHVNAAGARIGDGVPMPVGAGPTGVVLQRGAARLYVLCRFAAEIDTVDATTGTVLDRARLYDPTPEPIRAGRPVLYNTVQTSGQGQTACGSCHVDARTDGLAWDLGNPQGQYKSSADRNILRKALKSPADDYHPMKGPRTTQTLQDIIGHEPFHWSGDRDGLEAFSGAFESLLGDDKPLDPEPMARLKRFLATIVFPPNPYRNLDNTLPEHLDLSDVPGPLADDGSRPVLGEGNARRGLDVYMTANAGCSECHTIPSGRGTPLTVDNYQLTLQSPGPNAERHLRVSTGANTEQQTTYKMPPLAPVYSKTGLDYLSADGSTTGFGFFSGGAVDSVFRFALSMVAVKGSLTYQDRVDMFALVMAWGGSDFPLAQAGTVDQPPGMAGRDSHAALGQQVTIRTPGDDTTRLAELRKAVDRSPRIELIAKARRNGALRGWWYHEGEFVGDVAGAQATLANLVDASGPGAETTFTVVAAGTGRRLGIDRDSDGTPDAEDPTLDAVALDAEEDIGGEGDCPECTDTPEELHEGDTLCLHVDVADATAFSWSRDGLAFSNGPRVRGAFCDRFRIADLREGDSGTYRVDYLDASKAIHHETFVVTVNVVGVPTGRIAACGALVLTGLLGTICTRRVRRRSRPR